MAMNVTWCRTPSAYIILPTRLKRTRRTGQVTSFILPGPTLICCGPCPSELAHTSVPVVIRMIQDNEVTCGPLKEAQEPLSLHLSLLGPGKA